MIMSRFHSLEKSKTNYEICKKNWGYYISPSIDKRLKDYGHVVYITKIKMDKCMPDGS